MKDLRTEIRREDRRFDSETTDKTERRYASIGKKTKENMPASAKKKKDRLIYCRTEEVLMRSSGRQGEFMLF